MSIEMDQNVALFHGVTYMFSSGTSAFPTIASWFVLALVMVMIGGEVKAFLNALANTLQLMPKFRKMTKFTPGQYARRYLGLRYLWASPLLHERFAKAHSSKPNYSTIEGFMLFAVCYAIGKATSGNGGIEMVGMSAVFATAVFAFCYGRAFLNHRTHVNKIFASGNTLAR